MYPDSDFYPDPETMNMDPKHWGGGGGELTVPSQEEEAANSEVWCSRVEGSSRAALIHRYLRVAAGCNVIHSRYSY